MSDPQSALRAHAWDLAKATPIATFLGWLFSGQHLTYAATASGLFYTLLITFLKLKEVGFFRWVRRTFSPPPRPAVRTPQDE